MSVPLMVGGVPILLQAGAPELTEEAIGGDSLERMSDGAAVKQTHWARVAGSISAQGWIPPGLDGLDYSLPLELRSTQVSTMQSTGLVFELPTTPRPDLAPWAWALVGQELVPAECETVDGVTTVTAVPGAAAYQVWWMPVYSVFARKPSKAQSSGAGTQGWSMPFEEA